MTHITVTGSINVDVFLEVAALPRPNETIMGKAMRQAMGGKGLNQAVACARLGSDTRMIAATGDDALADQALAHLNSNGVATGHVRRVSGVATGLANIVVADTGENMIVVTPGANGLLSPADIDAAAQTVASAAALIVQLETPIVAVRRALEIARGNGVMTVLNPAPVDTAVMALLPLVDLVTPNETELMALTGITDLSDDALTQGLRALIAAGAKQAVVTLGAQGCATLIENALLRIPAYPVKAIDATGAGDVFNAALTVRVVAGDSLSDALRYASAASALSVMVPSADACPTPDQVTALMQTSLGKISL